MRVCVLLLYYTFNHINFVRIPSPFTSIALNASAICPSMDTILLTESFIRFRNSAYSTFPSPKSRATLNGMSYTV